MGGGPAQGKNECRRDSCSDCTATTPKLYHYWERYYYPMGETTGTVQNYFCLCCQQTLTPNQLLLVQVYESD